MLMCVSFAAKAQSSNKMSTGWTVNGGFLLAPLTVLSK